jgi:hypothetical protein
MKNPLCPYRDILGKSGEGIHSYRILDLAIMDILMTIIGAYLFSVIAQYPFLYSLIGFFILGIILHRLFCVRTTIDKWLFRE